MKTIRQQFGFTSVQQFVQFYDQLEHNVDQYLRHELRAPFVCPSGQEMTYLSFSRGPETMYWLYKDLISVLPWYEALPSAQQVYDTLKLAPPDFDRASWLRLADKLYGYFCNVTSDGTIRRQPADPELHTPWVVQDGRLVHYFGNWAQTVMVLPPEVTVVGGEAFVGCEAPLCLIVPPTVQRLEPGALCFCLTGDGCGIGEECLISVIVLQGDETVLEEAPDEPDESAREESFLSEGLYTVVAPAHSQPQEYALQRGWHVTDSLDEVILQYADPLYELENMRLDCLDYVADDRYRVDCAEQLMRVGLQQGLFDRPQQVLFAYCELAYRIGDLYNSPFQDSWCLNELIRCGWVGEFLQGRVLCTCWGDRDTGGPVRLIVDLRRRGACPEQALLGLEAYSVKEYLQMWFGRDDWAECWAECLLEHGKAKEYDALALDLIRLNLAHGTAAAADLVADAEQLAQWPDLSDPDALEEDDPDDNVLHARAVFPRQLLAAWQAQLD